MMNDLLTRVEELAEQMIKATQQLVSIKSVKADPLPNMPYGQGINDSLEYVLNLARDLNFKTVNYDGWAGHAEIGQGEKVVGILVHLDVVPEGSNWRYPPYGGEIHENKIYGRGTIDDKGPAVAALYAMKAIQDCGISLKSKVRLIFGTDEEIGGPGLDYYLEHVGYPDVGFSPDAGFPVIHGEKGIIIFNLVEEFTDSSPANEDLQIKSITGGNAPNMVPDHCQAVLSGQNLGEVIRALEAYVNQHQVNLEFAMSEDELVIKSFGLSAHGSTPEKGQNAISQLLVFLGTLNVYDNQLWNFIRFYAEKIGMESDGQSIGCGLEDDVSGKLIFNVGLIDLTETRVKMTINIRYPVTSSAAEVYQGMERVLINTGVKIEPGNHLEPLYLPADDPLVVKLMDVYRQITGDLIQPIVIGGGTYARSIKNAVAFGPVFPGQPELAHQKDEYIAIDDLLLNAKIYAQAILALADKS